MESTTSRTRRRYKDIRLLDTRAGSHVSTYIHAVRCLACQHLATVSMGEGNGIGSCAVTSVAHRWKCAPHLLWACLCLHNAEAQMLLLLKPPANMTAAARPAAYSAAAADQWARLSLGCPPGQCPCGAELDAADVAQVEVALGITRANSGSQRIRQHTATT